MQVVAQLVAFLVMFTVLFAFQYLRFTWLILSGFLGIFQSGFLRKLWFSTVSKTAIAILGISFLVSFVFRSRLFNEIGFSLENISFEINGISVGKLIELMLVDTYMWLQIAIAIAQGWVIKKFVTRFTWFPWILSSVIGTLLGKGLYAIIISSPDYASNSTWFFLAFVIPSSSMALVQVFSLHFFSAARRMALLPIWLVGWINAGLLMYFFQTQTLRLIDNFEFSRTLFQTSGFGEILYFAIPSLLTLGWFGIIINFFVIAALLPEEEFEPKEAQETSTGTTLAWNFADIAGRIAGNMTHEVGKVMSEEFNKSTRR